VLVSDETKLSLDGADELSASQDSAGGVYATWHDGRGISSAASGARAPLQAQTQRPAADHSAASP